MRGSRLQRFRVASPTSIRRGRALLHTVMAKGRARIWIGSGGTSKGGWGEAIIDGGGTITTTTRSAVTICPGTAASARICSNGPGWCPCSTRPGGHHELGAGAAQEVSDPASGRRFPAGRFSVEAAAGMRRLRGVAQCTTIAVMVKMTRFGSWSVPRDRGSRRSARPARCGSSAGSLAAYSCLVAARRSAPGSAVVRIPWATLTRSATSPLSPRASMDLFTRRCCWPGPAATTSRSPSSAVAARPPNPCSVRLVARSIPPGPSTCRISIHTRRPPRSPLPPLFIRAHRGHIGLITVSIGGNDVTVCAKSANPILHCGRHSQDQTDVTESPSALAADRGSLSLEPPTPTSCWVSGQPGGASGRALANLSLVGFKTFINLALKAAYARVVPDCRCHRGDGGLRSDVGSSSTWHLWG